MLSALLAQFWPYLLAIGGAGLFVWRMLSGAKKAGRNEQLAKEAEANAKRLRDINAAGNARPVGGVDTDPYNRDRR